MADTVIVTLEGIPQLQQRMRRLANDIGVKKMRTAMGKAGKFAQGEIQAAAPVYHGPPYSYRGKPHTPGTLAKSIVVKRIFRGEEITVLVGVSSGRTAQWDGFYARFLELGASQYPKPTGHGFMRETFRRKREATAKIPEEFIRRNIQRWERNY